MKEADMGMACCMLRREEKHTQYTKFGEKEN
jgi:hypothetical protein